VGRNSVAISFLKKIAVEEVDIWGEFALHSYGGAPKSSKFITFGVNLLPKVDFLFTGKQV